MRNLKRVLSLALASVMLVGMMAVGTSAAAFTDADEIVNADAVNTLVALNVINGKDDGSFDPTGIVTRGEMAKMICVALEGGVDPKLAAGSAIFADAATHWAGGYIDYCASLGILVGDDEGKVNANAPVKAVEAAKMVLVAIGYSADSEGFVGDLWATAIAIRAGQKKIYANVTAAPMDELSRDEAAVMVWNAMNATCVKYEGNLATDANGQLTTNYVLKNVTEADDGYLTIADRAYDLDSPVKGAITKVTYDEKTEKFTYTVNSDTYTVAEDLTDMFCMNVKVLVDTDGGIYGIIPAAGSVVYEGLVSDLSKNAKKDTVIMVDETEYALYEDGNTDAAIVYSTVDGEKYKISSADATVAALIGAADCDNYGVKLIDNTGDGKVDCVIVTPFTVAQVTSVSKTTVTADKPYTFEDNDIADGIAVGDYVYITGAGYSAVKPTSSTLVELAPVVGTVDATKGTSDKTYLVDGKWYTLDAGVTTAPAANTEYNLYIINSIIYGAVATGEVAKPATDLVYVASWAAEGDGDGVFTAKTPAKANVYFMDGTSEIVGLKEVYQADGSKATISKDTDPGLYTFSMKDDLYTLDLVDAADAADDKNTAGYEVSAKVEDGKVDAKKFGKTSAYVNVADDAVVLHIGTVGEKTTATVTTGATLKTWDASEQDVAYTFANAVNGIDYIKVMVIVDAGAMPGTAGVAGNYGIVMTDGYTVTKGTGTDAVKYASYSIWTKAGKIDVLDTDENEFAAGTVIKYTDDGEGYISDTDKVTKSDATVGALTGFNDEVLMLKDGADDIVLADGVVYLYVDSAKHVGYDEGKLTLATDGDDTDTDVDNNVIVIREDGKAVVVIVDINNAMAYAPADVD